MTDKVHQMINLPVGHKENFKKLADNMNMSMSGIVKCSIDFLFRCADRLKQEHPNVPMSKIWINVKDQIFRGNGHD